MNQQLERICAMERALNISAAAVAALEAALAQYQAALPQLAALAEYYQSPLWLVDFDADAAGHLPKDLPRGVLSEDAIYDLLCAADRLREKLRKAAELAPAHRAEA